MINFGQMMEAGKLLGRLSGNHPKFMAFLKAVMQGGVHEGTVIEIRVTKPDGQEYISNIRLSQEDLDCLSQLAKLQKNAR